MQNSTALVIEHCEPELSEWLMLEYRHAAGIWKGNLIFTNVPDEKTAIVLKLIGKVETGNAKKAVGKKKAIVLDPLASEPLKPDDFRKLDALVVGGILGFEQPQGRTKKLITDKCNYETRTLGPRQLSVDGAVFVAKAISMGMSLSDIEITNEVEIVHDDEHSTTLPFGYPVINDTPIITPGLIEYLGRE